jgi:hypothetical protein
MLSSAEEFACGAYLEGVGVGVVNAELLTLSPF